jgi:hypothetical protein
LIRLKRERREGRSSNESWIHWGDAGGVRRQPDKGSGSDIDNHFAHSKGLGCMVMKKAVCAVGIVLMMIVCVSATDCSGYFTKAADKRIKIISASSSLELTTDRLSTRADRLYNTLDDMNNDENLTSAADDFTELVDRKNDASDDMSGLKSALDAYDNAVSDSRSDLPNTCFKVFNMYDKDLSDLDDYYSNVRSAWNKFVPRYDIVAGYRSNLASHTVSEAKPKVDDLRDYIGDVYSEVTSNLATTINATTGVTDEKIYNQTECFSMVTKNVDIALKGCQDKCNTYLAGALKNCTGGPTPTTVTTIPGAPIACPDCTSALLKQQQATSDCETRYSALSSTCITTPQQCPVCETSEAKDTQITALSGENVNLSAKVNSLKSSYADANKTISDLNKALTDAKSKQGDCTIWMAISAGLVLLILAAWIFAL